MLFQQGDLLLNKTDSIPATAKLLKGDAVLHPGNTGNNHTLNGNAFGIFQDGDNKFVDVAETTTLTHNEHKMLFQQGDLLLNKTDSIPATAKLLKGDAVLHPGNTGNNHTLNGNAFGIFQDGDNKFVDVAETTTLTHNEHKPITLAPGKYALTFVREHDHFLDLVRNVVD